MQRRNSNSMRHRIVSIALTAAMAAQAVLPYQSMAAETGVSTELMTELAKAQSETPETEVIPETAAATETVPETVPETEIVEEAAPVITPETEVNTEETDAPETEGVPETTPSEEISEEENTPPHAESETELTEATPETDPIISDEEIPETETEAPSQPCLIWENDTYRITVSPADGSEFPAGFYFDALTLDDFGYAAEEQDALYDGFLTSAMGEMAAELGYPEDWAESDAAKDAVLDFEPLFMNVIDTDGSQVHGEYCYEIQITDPALLDSFLQGAADCQPKRPPVPYSAATL